MAKIPVQKTVMRNGKPHLQTYWEESARPQEKSGVLSSLQVPLPALPNDRVVNELDPVRQAWHRTPLIPAENKIRFNEDVEACIAAGFTPEAGIYLQSYVLGEGERLASYIYGNGLDQMIRPHNGWRFTRLGQDHRAAWMRAIDENGISLEQAVAWCDAGLDYPWSGIPELIKSGVEPERAQQWEENAQVTGLSTGAYLHLYKDELLSAMSIEEAVAWRKALKQTTSLSPRQIGFYDMGFKPEEAARWDGVLYYDVTAETAQQLREMKWSPTAIKGILRAMPGSRSTDKLTTELADELLRVTAKVGGTAVVRDWIGLVHDTFAEGFDSPAAIQAVVEAEAWKKTMQQKTGHYIPAEINSAIVKLSRDQREAYLEVMITPGREADTPQFAASRGLEVAKLVGSRENAVYLKESGYPLGATDTGIVNTSYGVRTGTETFNVKSSSPKELSQWMRKVAVSLYWRNTQDHPVMTSDREQVIANHDIDPIRLRDVLLERRGEIKPLQLEGMVLSGISSPVAEGWL